MSLRPKNLRQGVVVTVALLMSSSFPALSNAIDVPSQQALLGYQEWPLDYNNALPLPSNPNTSYTAAAVSAASLLTDKWYNTNTGLWDTTDWWQAANTLTTLSNLAFLDPTIYDSVLAILANSNTQAPNTFPGYLNSYYDDEGWWALAWINAYNLTGTPAYLQNAISIFDDMTSGWGTPCGGLWWDKPHSYIAAISNELFFSVAAHLANLVPSNATYYVNWAEKEWAWFSTIGLINADNNINDGIDLSTCTNNNGTVFSYNQGVLLGGLVQLNIAAPNSNYLPAASAIAAAAVDFLSDANGIIEECSVTCDITAAQFKGVFMRNLQVLQSAAPDDKVLDFIQRNADSVWNTARDVESGMLGSAWGMGFVGPGNATAQSSGLDALVAAAAFWG